MRMRTLLDQKKVMQAQSNALTRTSSSYIALEEGFRQFGSDLDKLQVCSTSVGPNRAWSGNADVCLTAIYRDQRYGVFKDSEESESDNFCLKWAHRVRGMLTVLRAVVGQNI